MCFLFGLHQAGITWEMGGSQFTMPMVRILDFRGLRVSHPQDRVMVNWDPPKPAGWRQVPASLGQKDPPQKENGIFFQKLYRSFKKGSGSNN